MRDTRTIATAVAILAALAAAAPSSADARVRHASQRGTHVARHVRPSSSRRDLRPDPAGVIYGQPPYLGPSAYPGYHYGGPLYSTCDRINADRMLVGTCR